MMLITINNNIMSHSEDACDFLNHIKDYGNTFSPKEINVSCTGFRVFQQDMISPSVQNNFHIIITGLSMLTLLSMMSWFKFIHNTSATLITTLSITMSRNTLN